MIVVDVVWWWLPEVVVEGWHSEVVRVDKEVVQGLLWEVVVEGWMVVAIRGDLRRSSEKLSKVVARVFHTNDED